VLTQGQQLEALDQIFHSKRPVKESIKKKFGVDASANIVDIGVGEMEMGEE
jgi:hypothetical protein